MTRKGKARKIKKAQLRRRIMRRQAGAIVGFTLILSILVIELIFNYVADMPDWLHSPIYILLVAVVAGAFFVFSWAWKDAGEKSEIDVLEEKLDKNNDNLMKAIKKQTLSINKLAQEIRKEREMWYERFKNR